MSEKTWLRIEAVISGAWFAVPLFVAVLHSAVFVVVVLVVGTLHAVAVVAYGEACRNSGAARYMQDSPP